MAVEVIRGAFTLSRNVIGQGVATVSDGSKGMRYESATCRALADNEADNGTHPRMVSGT
jgi:hypothetical protein